jgi:glucosamine--fructose-6-phosphate aminotransferase (isomerizing)
MCGIVGYIGPRAAVDVVVDGLSRLEYRGYDSGGVAVIEKGSLVVKKKAGKLRVLQSVLAEDTWTGNVSIGHTRWATHGRPTDANAHPHMDCTGKFAIVHNGIIENYLDIREKLLAKGHHLKSETDTEMMVHLIEDFYQGSLEEAVRQAVSVARGAYAIVAITEHEPDKIVAVRRTSPMILGLGDNEYFVASDIPAVLPYTKKTMIVNDGEMAVLTRQGIVVTDLEGQVVEKEILTIDWDIEAAEKGGFDHFMHKEIHEQPEVFIKAMSGRIVDKKVVFPDIGIDADYVKRLKRIHIVACGTAYHAGMVGKYAIERLARIPVETDIASEFRYRSPIIGPEDLMIVVSQSGETADTLAALQEAKAKGARVLAVTNVVGSSVAREADDVLYTWAGPEIAVASTKAYTTQILVLTLFAIYLAQLSGTEKPDVLEELLVQMRQIPDLAKQVMLNDSNIKSFAQRYKHCEDAFFIGRSLDFAVALEGALKLKEISYIHAEAYAAGELKHGTLALIVEGIPVIALITQKDVYEKTLSNIQEVKARDATVIAIARELDTEIVSSSDEIIRVPEVDDLLMPVLAVIPLQLIAYHMSVARDCDVDQPRNLAKSVTVE